MKPASDSNTVCDVHSRSFWQRMLTCRYSGKWKIQTSLWRCSVGILQWRSRLLRHKLYLFGPWK